MPKPVTHNLKKVDSRSQRRLPSPNLGVSCSLHDKAATTVTFPHFTFSNLDAVKWLKTLADSSVDLAITDPPYESLEKHRAIGTTTRLKHSKASSNDWFKIFPNSRFIDLFTELFRVLRRNSHLYVFCDPETAFIAKPIAEEAGFKFWKPLIWDKKRIGMGYHYRCRYEFILFFEKGKRKLSNLGVSDIIEVPRIIGGYPTEKPSTVSEILIQQSSSPGELVIDPFMGSGSVGVAALNLGRKFAGSDTCAEAISIARGRLLELQLDTGTALRGEVTNAPGQLQLSIDAKVKRG